MKVENGMVRCGEKRRYRRHEQRLRCECANSRLSRHFLLASRGRPWRGSLRGLVSDWTCDVADRNANSIIYITVCLFPQPMSEIQLSLQILLFLFSFWLIWFIWRTSRPRKHHSLRSVAILVLGDIGRSPRMMYHAQSFAQNNFVTNLIGYGGMRRVFC
jgi:hypothetical protein